MICNNTPSQLESPPRRRVPHTASARGAAVGLCGAVPHGRGALPCWHALCSGTLLFQPQTVGSFGGFCCRGAVLAEHQTNVQSLHGCCWDELLSSSCLQCRAAPAETPGTHSTVQPVPLCRGVRASLRA